MHHGMTSIIVVEAPASGVKKRQIGDVFASTLGSSGDTGKWIAPVDSAHQIGLSTCMEDVLIVVGGSSSLDLKISEIGHVSIYISTTRGAMAKRMMPFDSAHQIGISTCMEDVLIVVGALHRWILKNNEIEADFPNFFKKRDATAKQMPELDSA